jgi:hypothetical protein
MTGDDASDHTMLMDFFCNEWRAPGSDSPCYVAPMPENINALIVLDALTGSFEYSKDGKMSGAKNTEIKMAIDLLGISDARDCWARTKIILQRIASDA